MENHRHAKTHKKATQIHPMSNNSFIKSYKKVVDILIRLRYYKYEHRSLRTSQRATVYQTVALFCFPTESITNKKRNVKLFRTFKPLKGGVYH